MSERTSKSERTSIEAMAELHAEAVEKQRKAETERDGLSDETKPKVEIWGQGQPITIPDLRDRFAMAALTGLLASSDMEPGGVDWGEWYEDTVKHAFLIADEAMKAREAK